MKSCKSSKVRAVMGLSITTTVIIAIIFVGSGWPSQAADEKGQPDLSLQTFMRKKLDASSQILEGLTTEDSQLIQRGANSLLELSKAEKWKILIDSGYREHTVDFRNTVKKLVEAAEKNNFDNAALQWFDVTKSCIECHQDVRRDQKAKKK